MAVIQNEMKEKDTSMNNMTEQLSKYKLQIEELSREKDALQQKLDQLEVSLAANSSLLKSRTFITAVITSLSDSNILSRQQLN